MKRYWLEFEGEQQLPYGIKMGCGVTAHDEHDAIELVKARIFKTKPLPKISKMITDVDLSSLDAQHILPNMSPPNIRGIWFPLGYNS